jgi:hypothetical protein
MAGIGVKRRNVLRAICVECRQYPRDMKCTVSIAAENKPMPVQESLGVQWN